MFILGIFIHVVFLFSIFDIYFKSPIVKNVIPYQPEHDAPADRLVLFVVDGLRAESFVNYSTMPYLRSVANSHGRWGISNTRVPTESRPGHVAVIAGFYEDPSAVAKGWKENPVDFDSVFNQTKYTWCWGTYDIVDIFTKGSVDDHIFVQKFDPYDQSFSTDKNTTHLDAWVFNNVKEFFKNAEHNKDIKKLLHKKKIAFFLHLLGTDTSGHTHKPKTPNFLTTLRFVDEGIKEIEKIIKDFYNDGKTTFLMTSDHGMTDWGSHGAGDNHETQTPYVIWGAGIKQAIPNDMDPETMSMSLQHRLDINQADLTPLMSTILSIPVPVNSIGQLPAELLTLTLPNKAKAFYSNCRQLASQYNTKRLDVETNAIKLIYQPYEPFTERKYDEIIQFTDKAINAGDYEKSIVMSEEIMELSLSGLRYYHNYYQTPLLLLVTFSFIGWVVVLLKVLMQQNIYTQIDPAKHRLDRTNSLLQNCLNVIALMFCLTAVCLVHGMIIVSVLFCILIRRIEHLMYLFEFSVQKLPVQYHIYFLMPIFLWWHALTPVSLWIQVYRQLRKRSEILRILVEVILYTMGSIAMGLSFTYRWMLSIPLLGMGLWPFFSSSRKHLPHIVLGVWSSGCVLLSIFSFMPVVGKDVFIELVILAGIIWLIVLALYNWKIMLPLYDEQNKTDIFMSVIQMCLLIVSLENIYTQSKRFEFGTPVSNIYQITAWFLAVISLISPVAFSKRLICRLMAINTSVLIFYLLLSVSHEGLFMVALIVNVVCWLFIEFRLLHLKTAKITECTFDKENLEDKRNGVVFADRSINSQDFRRAFFFLLYIILAFFGTGNIASLNSFEVRWVTCFLTSFQPFLITTLILLKTISPFLIVGCVFRGVQHLTKAPTGYLNVIVLIYSNFMGVQLLYNVRNTGSWLEIGTSISQFVIVQVITLFIVLINQTAKIFTDVTIHNISSKVFKSRKKYI